MVQKLHVKIKGLRGLLMNRNTSIGVDLDQPKSLKKRSTEHNFEEEAKQCLYIRKDGKIGVPSLAILAALKKAAVNMRKAGGGKKTLKDYVYSGLSVDSDDKYILISPQNYKVDVQAVCPTGRGRIPKARPLFDEGWVLNFDIVIVDETTWGPGEVRQCLAEAGLYAGLLDYRPLYGQFVVESITDEKGREIK